MDWDRYQRGVDLEESGKIEEALAEFRKLVNTSADPVDNELVYLAIANCLRQLGRRHEAKKFVDRAYAVLPQNNQYYPSVMFIDACIEQELGNWKQALAKLDSILEKYPSVLENPDYEDLKIKVLGNRGYVLVELKRFAEARPLLEFALSKDYDADRTLFYLGACCYGLGDLKEAQRYLREAATHDLDPIYAVNVHYYLGLTHLYQGQPAWARQEFEWCLQHDERGKVRKDFIIQGLVMTSKALGLNKDAERYSKMLHEL